MDLVKPGFGNLKTQTMNSNEKASQSNPESIPTPLISQNIYMYG